MLRASYKALAVPVFKYALKSIGYEFSGLVVVDI